MYDIFTIPVYSIECGCAGVARRQAAVGAVGVRRRGGDLRAQRDHLAPRYHTLQQVTTLQQQTQQTQPPQPPPRCTATTTKTKNIYI